MHPIKLSPPYKSPFLKPNYNKEITEQWSSAARRCPWFTWDCQQLWRLHQHQIQSSELTISFTSFPRFNIYHTPFYVDRRKPWMETHSFTSLAPSKNLQNPPSQLLASSRIWNNLPCNLVIQHRLLNLSEMIHSTYQSVTGKLKRGSESVHSLDGHYNSLSFSTRKSRL